MPLGKTQQGFIYTLWKHFNLIRNHSSVLASTGTIQIKSSWILQI
jgi:hypothetical protein